MQKAEVGTRARDCVEQGCRLTAPADLSQSVVSVTQRWRHLLACFKKEGTSGTQEQGGGCGVNKDSVATTQIDGKRSVPTTARFRIITHIHPCYLWWCDCTFSPHISHHPPPPHFFFLALLLHRYTFQNIVYSA